MKHPHFTKVWIDDEVADTSVANAYAEYAEQWNLVLERRDFRNDDTLVGLPTGTGKREVIVRRRMGAFIKQCTGLEDHQICCNLHVMNITTNCPMDCSYCFLLGYINRPITTVYANLDEIVAGVRTAVEQQPNRLFRVGTGDLSDSLALDPIGQIGRWIVPQFANIPNAILELKTKTVCVDGLLDLDNGGRTVVSWSVNPPHVISTEEHGCASLGQRLGAARKAVGAGYLIGFHFDPMIVYDGWQADYGEVVRRIFEAVPSERVAWISMGSLRFPPSMRRAMDQRYPNNQLTSGELILGPDGKMRYLKPLRLELYRCLLRAIRKHGGEAVWVYLCMERKEIWRRVLGASPQSISDLDFQFASHLIARYPHLMSKPPQWDDYDGAPSLAAGPGDLRTEEE